MRSDNVSDKTPETPGTPLSSEAAGAPASEPQIEPAVSASDHVSLGSASADQGAEAIPPELVDPSSSTTDLSTADLSTADLSGADLSSAEPLTVEPELADEESAAVAEPSPARAVQTVYIRAPQAPPKKGNRGIGSLIALGSAIIFAAIYAGVAALIMPLFAPPKATAFEFIRFINNSAFFVPVLVFALFFVLLVLVLNRAGWWAHILGSLVVGILVYFVSIGILLLLNNVIGMTPSGAAKAFRVAAESPLIITAGLVSREVSLWMGATIAARGRRVKAKNADARASFDRDSARARAEYESAVAANASR
jgi:hypothetical protein